MAISKLRITSSLGEVDLIYRQLPTPRSSLSIIAAVLLAPAMVNGQDTAASDTIESFGELSPDFGWLSPKDKEPADIVEAIVGGKIHFNNRFRVELVEQDGFDYSTAVTNRVRFGYESKKWQGFSFMVEGENVTAADRDLFFVPGIQGDSSRAVVADPNGTEVNQAHGRFEYPDFGIDFKVGRQRIAIDDHRFVGNVGWRQFEQTFDAISIHSSFGIENLDAFYAYVWRVQRIFGPEGPNWDLDAHLFNVSYAIMPELKATGFVYLFDVHDAPAASNATYGFRLTGEVTCPAHESLSLGYILSYAYQTDYGDRSPTYDADYFNCDLYLGIEGYGKVGAGYELLGSDDGISSFTTPFATGHKFNGWADVFLATPAAGLQDFYVYTSMMLPGKIDGLLAFHQFWNEQSGADLGWEMDLQLRKQLTRNWSVLAKYAWFDGEGSIVDRNKFWLETTFTF